MKKPMTIETALNYALDALGYCSSQGMDEEYDQASDILRNMAEEPVEKKRIIQRVVCKKCRQIHSTTENTIIGDIYMQCECNSETILNVWNKIYESTRVLKIVETETDVKFEEVD